MWSDLDPDQTIRCPHGVKPWQKRAVNGGRCRDCRRLIFDLLNFSAIPSILFSCSALSPRPTTHATRSPTRPNTDKNAARAPKNGQHCHILAISIPRPPKLAGHTNPSPQGALKPLSIVSQRNALYSVMGRTRVMANIRGSWAVSKFAFACVSFDLTLCIRTYETDTDQPVPWTSGLPTLS